MEKTRKVTRIHREIASLSKDQLISYLVSFREDHNRLEDRFKALESFVIHSLADQQLRSSGFTEQPYY